MEIEATIADHNATFAGSGTTSWENLYWQVSTLEIWSLYVCMLNKTKKMWYLVIEIIILKVNVLFFEKLV